MLAGPILAIGAFAREETRSWESSFVVYVVIVAGVALMAVGSGPRLVLLCARRLRNGGRSEALLAGWWLEADPHAAGRVAGVLILCGCALGYETVLAASAAEYGIGTGDLAEVKSYGYVLVLLAAATIASIAVAVLTLFVGAAEQLLDARRSLATLAAAGADEATLARVLRLQLSRAAFPAVLSGRVVVGGLLAIMIALSRPSDRTGIVAAFAGVGAAVCSVGLPCAPACGSRCAC